MDPTRIVKVSLEEEVPRRKALKQGNCLNSTSLRLTINLGLSKAIKFALAKLTAKEIPVHRALLSKCVVQHDNVYLTCELTTFQE